MGKNNAKGGGNDKKAKGKEKEKAGDSSKGESADKGKGLKAANSINVRHILVCDVFFPFVLFSGLLVGDCDMYIVLRIALFWISHFILHVLGLHATSYVLRHDPSLEGLFCRILEGIQS
jgi:hypothetical protein